MIGGRRIQTTIGKPSIASQRRELPVPPVSGLIEFCGVTSLADIGLTVFSKSDNVTFKDSETWVDCGDTLEIRGPEVTNPRTTGIGIDESYSKQDGEIKFQFRANPSGTHARYGLFNGRAADWGNTGGHYGILVGYFHYSDGKTVMRIHVGDGSTTYPGGLLYQSAELNINTILDIDEPLEMTVTRADRAYTMHIKNLITNEFKTNSHTLAADQPEWTESVMASDGVQGIAHIGEQSNWFYCGNILLSD